LIPAGRLVFAEIEHAQLVLPFGVRSGRGDMTMKKLQILAATLVLTTITAGAAFAGPPATPRVTARQERQQARIAQGVKSGQLSPRETARLERGEARIQCAKAAAKADGNVTPSERRHLNRMENRESARIWADKHN
jgi:hypothetical protein